MRALVICGVLLLSGTATAQDRASCFHNCVEIYYGCRHQCPLVGSESTPCVQTCVAQTNECKKQCNRRYPNPRGDAGSLSRRGVTHTEKPLENSDRATLIWLRNSSSEKLYATHLLSV
jgi:hypothetical protein